jgi:40S ribosome biogenesis protein Tsr1 and BMS1 C-terminal
VQACPVFSQEDNNQRHRMLKYSPEHMHCRATIYGPLAPPQTGVVAVQSLSEKLSGWRISATASVLELDAKFDIMKKLKLVGYPYKVERHTAFVKDMFTSQVRCPAGSAVYLHAGFLKDRLTSQARAAAAAALLASVLSLHCRLRAR